MDEAKQAGRPERRQRLARPALGSSSPSAVFTGCCVKATTHIALVTAPPSTWRLCWSTWPLRSWSWLEDGMYRDIQKSITLTKHWVQSESWTNGKHPADENGWKSRGRTRRLQCRCPPLSFVRAELQWKTFLWWNVLWCSVGVHPWGEINLWNSLTEPVRQELCRQGKPLRMFSVVHKQALWTLQDNLRTGQRRWDVASSSELWGGGENSSKVITLDLKELVKAGLGRTIAELPSPWIRRHEGATERADKSLTLFADVRTNRRGFLTDRNLSGIWSNGSEGAFTSETSTKCHWGTKQHDTRLSLLMPLRKRFIREWLKNIYMSPKPLWQEEIAAAYDLTVPNSYPSRAGGMTTREAGDTQWDPNSCLHTIADKWSIWMCKTL